MKVKVTPSKVHGNVKIPASKSMAHRALICASLSDGTSIVSNVTNSKDIEATVGCMKALGAIIKQIDETTYEVTGTNLFKQEGNITCNANESGSTLRFLIPLAACTNAKVKFLGQGRLLQRPMDVYENESGSTLRFLIPLAACTNAKVKFLGQGRLLQRPMDVYENEFKKQNIEFNQSDKEIIVSGNLKAKDYVVQGDISSQFITGFMFVLPLLDQDSTLTITEPYESKSYVNLTIQMLAKFGIEIIETSSNSYLIKGNQHYKAQDVSVEGDFSQLAFFAVLGTLNNTLSCSNMDMSSKQGDKAILDCIPSFTSDKDTITFTKKQPAPQTIDLSNCPDLGPILCVLASFTNGETNIVNAARLRMKESDRILAMETELKKWGVDITSTFDSIQIHGKEHYKSDRTVEIFGHNDHRIVMAMTVFGLCAGSECIIDDAQAITKSYPTFFEDIQSLGGKVEIL